MRTGPSRPLLNKGHDSSGIGMDDIESKMGGVLIFWLLTAIGVIGVRAPAKNSQGIARGWLGMRTC